MHIIKSALLTMLGLSITVGAEEINDNSDNLSPERQAGIISQVSPGIVTVQYFLRYEKGQPPKGANTTFLCHSCGRYHTREVGEELIREQRPLEETGFLVEPGTVITRDTTLGNGCIGSIRVLSGNNSSPAHIAAYSVDNNAVLLEIEKPLDNTKPLLFTGKKDRKLLMLTSSQIDGIWTTTVRPFSSTVNVRSAGDNFLIVPTSCLILDDQGIPVSLAMNSTLPVGEAGLISPLKWKTLTAKDFAAKLDNLKKTTDQSFLRVQLNFRSQKAKDEMQMFRSRIIRSSSAPGDEHATDFNTLGICIGNNRILVMANLEPETTARLEKITVYDPDGRTHSAKFSATVSEYGALIATCSESIGKELKFEKTDITSQKHKILLKARLLVAGEQRIAEFLHGRLVACKLGRKNRISPIFDGEQKDVYFFTPEGRLIALPVVFREKVSTKSSRRWSSSAEPEFITFAELLSALDKTSPQNVPLDQKNEQKTAWLGATLQKMTPELAQMNHCTDQTKNGETGAIISMVYPDSPAEKAGIKPGMILLRLEVQDEPKPVEVTAEDDMGRSMPFQWERLGEMPAEYFDQIPPPWGRIENGFTRLLTDLGFGTKFKAFLLNKEEELSIDFTVVESPTHFDAARRYKSISLGITVRDMTFEVCQYLRKTKDDPGVVISKVEPGSTAAVAGIRPYEVITHINGKPVSDVDQFTKLTADVKELSLSVNRMAESRQVLIKQDKTGK